ncbi:MAG: hypothetical protein V4651_04860 [Bacteroidota bacterium]
MKTILKIFLVMCCIQPLLLMAQETTIDTHKYVWKKARNNSWPGVVDQQTYRYKLDANAKLWFSADGKNWQEDADGIWSDKEAVFYKLDGTKLIQSTDGGNTWNETPEWKWLAIDGRWYRLDKDWDVWVSK